MPLEIEPGHSGDGDARTMKRTLEHAATRRDLPCAEPHLAEALCPIGNERAMGRPGDRILVDPDIGCKEARDEIDVTDAGRRDDDRIWNRALKRRKIGSK